MARWTLGFLIGVVWITHFSHLPSVKLAYLLIALSIILIILNFFKLCFSSNWVLFFIACCLGFSWSLIIAHQRLAQQLPKILEGKTLIAKGRILTIPENHSGAVRFDFLIQNIETSVPIQHPISVRIKGYFYKNSNILTDFKKGDIWQFALRLRRPRAFWNPGSFDYQAELFQQNISATGYLLEKFPLHLIQRANAYYFIDNLRQKITANVKKALQGYPLLGLISALTTGIRCEITDEQWQVMRGTGTNHLFAISGLHLASIAGIIYWIVRFICCRIPYATLYIPAPKIASALTFLSAIFYSALAGFAIPTQRALLMLSAFSLAIIKRRYLTSWHSFHLALLIILIIEPFSVLSASFWLSFTAVILIFYAVSHRIKPSKNWRAWCRIQLTVSLGLIPLSLLFFHQISWISFVANLIAIPTIGFLILPLSLLGSLISLVSLVLGNQLLIFAEQILELLWKGLNFFSEIPLAQYYAYLSGPWILVSSLIGILLVLAPKGMPTRCLGFIWILPLFFGESQRPHYGDIWIHLLDVGQGLASVVRTQHHVLIYDTGPRLSPSFDTGKLVILPFLQTIDVQKVNLMVISHGDNDHSGGAMIILKQIQVDKVLSSLPKKFLPNIVNLCEEKLHWQWDGINFEILYPPMNHHYLGNNSSCVLKISNGLQSILLVGDIEKAAENYLVHSKQKDLQSSVLIVPHHGSKTSSSIEFLNHVQPVYALFPTGFHNRFKFPHKIVLNRYQRLGSKIYNTATEGTITLKLNALSNTIQAETYYEKNHHFWQD
ncbi:DNA internalization-related competence protein ComEC/Rec2 [Rickettsiella endosymbiont of Miltochrista miniata]|uniref:DNA internalization-related competence protein ComEC/Rec2 n=1 Tax=Rickettsiella endosymbiont of Miltochrista miniata TaxID=3066239 RepID=UPI00313EBE74